MFNPDQVKQLNSDLMSRHVKARTQSGRTLSYIEGWHAIAEANRIFGEHAWIRRTLSMDCVNQQECTIGKDDKKRPGWNVSYLAKVEVVVTTPEQDVIYRHGTGAGHGIDANLGIAHESAAKEAETDAMKRALMTFGNPFGLALYDKDQKNVCDVDLARLKEFEEGVEASTDSVQLEELILEYTPDILELKRKRQADWRLLNDKVSKKRAELKEKDDGAGG